MKAYGAMLMTPCLAFHTPKQKALSLLACMTSTRSNEESKYSLRTAPCECVLILLNEYIASDISTICQDRQVQDLIACMGMACHLQK